MTRTLKNFGLLYLLLAFVGACFGGILVMDEPDRYTLNPLHWDSEVYVQLACVTTLYWLLATCVSYIRNEK